VAGGRSSFIGTYEGIFLGMRGKAQVVRVSDEATGYLKDGKPCKWGTPGAAYGRYTRTRQTTYWSGRIFKLAD
jgi:hypothetical protein